MHKSCTIFGKKNKKNADFLVNSKKNSNFAARFV